MAPMRCPVSCASTSATWNRQSTLRDTFRSARYSSSARTMRVGFGWPTNSGTASTCVTPRAAELEPRIRRNPYPSAQIGAWGYDPLDDRLLPPTTTDLMSYCGGWISDYHYAKALRHRLSKEGGSAPAPARSLLMWGGIDADGRPFLEPAFAVDAPALLPDSAGEYRLAGRSAAGRDLFSLDFAMAEVADGDGRSSFVFALPAPPQWVGDLASVTLTGPGGSFALDGDSDLPMTILRDSRTGSIRGFLRQELHAAKAAMDGVRRGIDQPAIEALFSRGIPGTDAWRR